MAYVIPLLFLFVIIYAVTRGVNVFSAFCEGAQSGLKFTLSILPTLAVIFMMCEIFERSGLSDALTNFLAPAFKFFGVPQELSKLILIKPFSGSGSLAYLTKIMNLYGADSHIARCACVIYGSSETVFYISAVYFTKTKPKNLLIPIIIILLSTLVSTIFGVFLCNLL